MAKTGVIIGRFQVPFLHRGHHHLISEVMNASDQVVILLGVTHDTKSNEKNPLPFHIRKEMILKMYKNVTILPLRDNLSDMEWSSQVDGILGNYEDPMLYGSRDCFKSSYSGTYPFAEIPEIESKSGTFMRENIEVANNVDFRKGLIYAYQNRSGI